MKKLLLSLVSKFVQIVVETHEERLIRENESWNESLRSSLNENE